MWSNPVKYLCLWLFNLVVISVFYYKYPLLSQHTHSASYGILKHCKSGVEQRVVSSDVCLDRETSYFLFFPTETSVTC